MIRAVVIALSAVVASIVVALAVAVLFVDFDALIARYRDRAVNEASTAIGRRVEVAKVEPSWWPVGIEAKEITVEGLGHAESLQIRFEIFEILKSFGREIVVDSIVLVRPVVELTRDDKGRTSYGDVVEHLKNRPKGQREVQIDQLAIEDGIFTFIDDAAPRGTGLFFADDIDAELVGSQLTVNMGVLSETHNVELTANTGLGLTALEQVNVRIQGVPLRAMRLWLPKDSTIDVLDAELSGDLEIDENGDLMGDSNIAELGIDGVKQHAELAIEGRIGDDAIQIRTARGTMGRHSLEASGRIAKQDVRIERFRLRSGENVITGSATVRDFSNPKITFSARAKDLDVDALRAQFSGGGKGGSKVAKISVDGKIEAERGRASGVEFRELMARVHLREGKLLFETASMKAYDGRITADGTVVDLNASPLSYRLAIRFGDVDAGALFSGATSLGRTLVGKMAADLDLRAEGSTWPEIASSLTGQIGAHLEKGRFEGVNLVRQTVEPLLGALPLVQRATGIDLPQGNATEFRELGGTFYVDRGMMRIVQPLRIQTDAGTVAFTGGIGLDRKLALDGRFELTPAMIARISGGRLHPENAVPIGVELGCTLLSPCVKGVDVEEAARGLVEMQAKRSLRSLFDRL
jgi:hypothetical protein